MSPRDRASQGSKDFGDEISQKALYASSAGLCSIVFTIGTTATEVRQIQQDRGEQARCEFRTDILMFSTGISTCQFQKDRGEQARCASLFRCSRAMSTADIVARKVCQFQKDRDEQARCASLYRYYSAMSTADIVAMKVCQFQKDRGGQARCASLFRYSRAMSAADIVAMKVCQFASLVLPIANVSLVRSQFGAKQARCGLKSCSLLCICLLWTQEVDYSHTDFHHSAHVASEQEFGFSHTVCHHTAHIVWALGVACGHADCWYSTHFVWAQEVASSHTDFHYRRYCYSKAAFHHIANM